ncbi:MAG: DUF4058 family protein [Fibrella sp.]|nr:DUF4058 family protein [Armatimonadota bacterium]
MPSPFPGMDPYLENPRWWRGIHASLVTEIMGCLNAQLPIQFVACVEERVFRSLEDNTHPDIALIERPRRSLQPFLPAQTGAHVADGPLCVSYTDEEVYESYLEIRTTDKQETLVAVIEVLSPRNKNRESNGRDVYLKKRDTVLNSGTHLIEIDLLRDGAYTTAAPHDLVIARAGDLWHYSVCLHRAGSGNKFDVWAASVRERLPRILVPLTAGFPDVVLDMQAAITKVYARGGFDRSIDYRRDPVPALPPADSLWADELLKSKGLR